MTTPSLRCRSVTGWPHHLIPQISCAPAVQRDLQNHSGPGRHRGNLRCAPRGCGSTRKAPALQAVSCGSVTRHLQCCARQYFPWELPRLSDCKSAVKKPVGRRPVEHYHQLPPICHTQPWVPKPKSSRRTVVNRVTSGCKSRRNRHGRNFNHNLGHEEDSQSAPLGTARHPERNRGARPLFLPVAQEQSWRLLNARSQVQVLPG